MSTDLAHIFKYIKKTKYHQKFNLQSEICDAFEKTVNLEINVNLAWSIIWLKYSEAVPNRKQGNNSKYSIVLLLFAQQFKVMIKRFWYLIKFCRE